MEIGVNVLTIEGGFVFGEAPELAPVIYSIVKAADLLYSSIGKKMGKMEIDLDSKYIYVYVMKKLIVYTDSELSERDLIKLAKKYGK